MNMHRETDASGCSRATNMTLLLACSQRRRHALGGYLIGLRQQVGVGREHGLRVVSEPCRDDVHRDAARQHQRRRGVPQRVRRPGRDPRGPAMASEPLRERVWPDQAAELVGEDQVVILVVACGRARAAGPRGGRPTRPRSLSRVRSCAVSAPTSAVRTWTRRGSAQVAAAPRASRCRDPAPATSGRAARRAAFRSWPRAATAHRGDRRRRARGSAEVLELLTAKARQGSTSAMIALERALRNRSALRNEPLDGDFDELERLMEHGLEGG
jgi:hypothetical protein